jgi:hypothetical protein
MEKYYKIYGGSIGVNKSDSEKNRKFYLIIIEICGPQGDSLYG